MPRNIDFIAVEKELTKIERALRKLENMGVLPERDRKRSLRHIRTCVGAVMIEIEKQETSKPEVA